MRDRAAPLNPRNVPNPRKLDGHFTLPPSIERQHQAAVSHFPSPDLFDHELARVRGVFRAPARGK
jgi:hypothetical protein